MSFPLPGQVAIVLLGPGAVTTARRVKRTLPGAEIHAPSSISADQHYARLLPHLRQLFRTGRPIVGLCAAAILIRALSPLLRDKRAEPPVLAVAEDGSSIVPLLGGHRGGNALARAIARATGGLAAITTASDLRFGGALDEPPQGWRVANPSRAKAPMAKLLAGKPLTLRVEVGAADWLAGHPQIVTVHDGHADICVTDRLISSRHSSLVLRPPVLALGVGTSRGCSNLELATLARRTLRDAGFAAEAVAAVVSIDLKMDEPAVLELARTFAVPARFFDAKRLRRETRRLTNPSPETFRTTGCYGVAEGAALAAVGAAGSIVVPKRKSAHATCAVARAPLPLDPTRFGRARGSLAIIGIGPGSAEWRTPEASASLAAASDVVGYRLYLDLLGETLAGKRRHTSELGAETDRARRALALASEGRAVALVSSGDAGIYGLATLVFELIDQSRRPDWRRIAITVVPGISALQAAAARVGAPLGHDFCAVSLSDLLTPWRTIERRLKAAAEGDFVVALYNPRSARRSTQLARARRLLLRARPPETPVIIARNLGRNGETIERTTLGAFDTTQADMLSLVLIGSSATRALDNGLPYIYTPRGYARKRRSGNA